MRSRNNVGEVCRLIWIRHAGCEGEGLFLGQEDVPLSTSGRRQLPALAQKISPYRVQAIYTSDFRRAVATAAAISRTLGIKAESRSSLREIQFGCWEGLSWTEVSERFPQAASKWMRNFPREPIPGGECFHEFKARVRQELRELIAAHRGECAVVVTHAGVIRVMLASALGIPDRYLSRINQDYGGMSIIEYFRGGAVVQCVNA